MTRNRFFILLFLIFALPYFHIDNKLIVNALEDKIEQPTFIHSAGRTSSLLLSKQGIVYAWGLWGESNDVTLSKKFVNPTDISSNLNIDEDDYFVNVFSGEQHSFLLTNKGKVFAMGSGEKKQLAYSDYFFKPTPVDLTNIFDLSSSDKIIYIGCGDDFNIALTLKHKVIAFGKNEDGQLGIKDGTSDMLTYNITDNFVMQDGDYIKDVKCGASHAIALSNNGYVYVWGANQFGQLGIKDVTILSTPTRLEEITESVIQVDCGRYSSYVLTNQGQLYGFGSDSYGQLATKKPIITSNKKTTPYLMNGSFPLESDEYIKEIKAGYYYAYIKTNLNNYYSFGQNSSGQLGNNSTISTSFPQKLEYKTILNGNDEIVNMSCGLEHCIAVSKLGHILAWGSNLYGQLAEDYNGPQTNYSIVDITYQFPPIIVISTNASSSPYKSYILDVDAYYLDNQEIEDTYYCLTSSPTLTNEKWQSFNKQIVVEEGEGNVYVHLKIESEKETYYHVSKAYFLDHVAPTISVTDKNNKEITDKYYNSTIFVNAMDNNSYVDIVYTHDGQQYTTNTNTLSLSSDGIYQVYAMDVAKNTSATIEFTIDTILPTITKIDNNFIKQTSYMTREREITIQGSEALSCFQLAYKGEKVDSYTALNENEDTFTVKLKKGVNTLIILDLAGNESLTYEITYSPRFFQDTQLLLLVFGSIAAVFVVIIVIVYTIRNKKKLAK